MPLGARREGKGCPDPGFRSDGFSQSGSILKSCVTADHSFLGIPGFVQREISVGDPHLLVMFLPSTRLRTAESQRDQKEIHETVSSLALSSKEGRPCQRGNHAQAKICRPGQHVSTRDGRRGPGLPLLKSPRFLISGLRTRTLDFCRTLWSVCGLRNSGTDHGHRNHTHRCNAHTANPEIRAPLPLS